MVYASGDVRVSGNGDVFGENSGFGVWRRRRDDRRAEEALDGAVGVDAEDWEELPRHFFVGGSY